MSTEILIAPVLSNAGVLIGAATLDYLIGDPWSWPHPVQGMGWMIKHYRSYALKYLTHPWSLKVAGMGLTLLLSVGSAVIAWAIIFGAAQFSPMLCISLQIVMLASCFAGRSLRRAAEDVLMPLGQGDIEQARSRLKLYVGRDTEDLSETEILRAVLETVSENSVDGVMAPLFFALMGSAIPGLGPVPLAIAYKAVSTLDSMVGYQDSLNQHLGWCSAKSDDGLTWIPCRLTVLTLSLLSGHPFHLWQVCQRDAPQDPSPNSGWSECAYAVSLGVQLGGHNRYRGVIKTKPLVGDFVEPITPAIIRKGLQLNRACFMLWISLFFVILAVSQSHTLFSLWAIPTAVTDSFGFLKFIAECPYG